MTTQPIPLHTHIWDGTRTIPDWLGSDQHRWDNGQLVIQHPDSDTPMRAGWTLVHWTDGMITVASPRLAERLHGPGGLVERAGQLAAALREALDCITFGLGHADPDDYDRWRAVLDQRLAGPAATEATKEQS